MPMNTVPFAISNLRRHDGKTLVAFFDVTLPGVIISECRLHVARYGAFVDGPGKKSAFALGGWQKHAQFDDDLALEIQAAVEARLASDEGADHVA